MLPRAAAGADRTNGSLLAPAKAGVRDQERSLQVHSLPAPGGFQPGEDEQPICSRLLRNTTGGDNRASRGTAGLWVRTPEVTAIWLGGLGATWKGDMQGVRTWGQAESRAPA